MTVCVAEDSGLDRLEYDSQFALACAIADATLKNARGLLSEEELRSLLGFVEGLFSRIGAVRRELRDIAPVVMDLDVLLEGYYSEHEKDENPRALLTFLQRKLRQQTVVGIPFLNFLNTAIEEYLCKQLNRKHAHAFLILYNQLRKAVGEIVVDRDAVVVPEEVDVEDAAKVNFTLTRFDTTHMVDCDMDGLRIIDRLSELRAFGDNTDTVVASIDFSSEISADGFELPERSLLISGWGKFVFPSKWIEGVDETSDEQLGTVIEKIELFVEEIVAVRTELDRQRNDILKDMNGQRKLLNISFDFDTTHIDEFYGRRITFESVNLRLRALRAGIVGYFGLADGKIKEVKITMGVEDRAELIDSTLAITLSSRTSITVEQNLDVLRKVADKFSLSGLMLKKDSPRSV